VYPLIDSIGWWRAISPYQSDYSLPLAIFLIALALFFSFQGKLNSDILGHLIVSLALDWVPPLSAGKEPWEDPVSCLISLLWRCPLQPQICFRSGSPPWLFTSYLTLPIIPALPSHYPFAATPYQKVLSVPIPYITCTIRICNLCLLIPLPLCHTHTTGH
jgi:hypothetical protein